MSQGPTEAEWSEAHLVHQICDIHASSTGTYGVPRIAVELADKGWAITGNAPLGWCVGRACTGTVRPEGGR